MTATPGNTAATPANTTTAVEAVAAATATSTGTSTYYDGDEVDFEPRPQDVIMWSLKHAQHPGNKYYKELLNETSHVLGTTTTITTSSTRTVTAATATSTEPSTDKSTTINTASTTPNVSVPDAVDNSTPRAKAATVVDHIMREIYGRFLQLVNEPSRRCKINARNDAIQKVSQELTWQKDKKQTAAKHLLLAKEAQLKEQQELQKELKKKQARIAKAAATALIVASERAAAQRAAEKAAAEKAAAEAPAKEAAANMAAAAKAANNQISLGGPLKLPARRPPSYTRLVAGLPLAPSQQRANKPKARIKTASELSMKPGQLSGGSNGRGLMESSESDGSGVAASGAAGAMGPPPNHQKPRQLHGPPTIVHKQIPGIMPPPAPQYNKVTGTAIPQHHQQCRYGHGDHHQNQLQRYRQPAQQPPPPQQPQQQQPWLRVHQDQIEENIPKDASCVVHIFDRRVNLDSHPADVSVYSFLRSWAQDDPCRKIQVPVMSTTASKIATVTCDNGDNDGSNSSRTTGKRPADDMLMTLTATAMEALHTACMHSCNAIRAVHVSVSRFFWHVQLDLVGRCCRCCRRFLSVDTTTSSKRYRLD